MEKKKTFRRGVVIVIVLVVVGFSGALIFKKKAVVPPPMAIPVLTGKVTEKPMPVLIEAIGTVQAYNSITIMSRVVGQITKIHFTEGQDVRKGDPLVTIDPGPYREKLKIAEAKLHQDEAQLKFNQDEAKRYAYLMERGAVSRSDFENKQTLSHTQEAQVRADKADVDNARLDLSYCFITSPTDGRTGAHLVNDGAMVKDNDTKLTVVNRITPIYVKFSVPEKSFSEIRRWMERKTLSVEVLTDNPNEKVRTGTLTFVDNTVDTTTGMITLKATFENKDRFLWPGQFVNVRLNLHTEENALVVPAAAVQISENGTYAFVVAKEGTVQYRQVAVARTIGDESVVTKGVKQGETVVTDGHLKLKDGFPVEIRNGLSPSQKGANGTGSPAPQSDAKPNTQDMKQ